MFKIENINKKLVSNVIFVAALAALVIFRAPGWIQSYKTEGNKVSSATVYDLNQNKINLPETIKKPAALFFWATWCGVCKLELSRVQALVDSKEIMPDHIYAISVGEPASLVRSESEKRHYNFQILADESGSAAKIFNVSALPTVLLIDENSNVAWASTGISPTINFRLKKLIGVKN